MNEEECVCFERSQGALPGDDDGCCPGGAAGKIGLFGNLAAGR